MKKKIICACLIGMTAFFINACGVRNVTAGMEEGEAYDAVVSVKPAEEKDTKQDMLPANGGLGSLLSMIGKTDEESAGLLGGGAENRTADTGQLVGRSYRADCLGGEHNIHTSYDENGRIFLVVVELTDGSAEEYRRLIEAFTGEAGVRTEEDREEVSLKWEKGGCIITLYDDGEAVSLDITPAEQ